ncbi:isoprenylcysteine carboxylmethyltransferase family protein (plasmid) [Rhizobium ruizarguesonis]|uniref:methyltransferase family protein n=1 Tax=Rhizobium ruizarguesonis TaxID=2081791 RepID=UPI0010323E89|nr:isoprenylcysteine carboxylmethyltransferase family protein [Rhizobium ruizarguesonis]TAY30840.1 isoprenylcysteine carboxylmethyltransferase family protein [Rhizobium ruizarguesonis]TAY44978.1 isoprenylcysteine carboxylmethyltransferase family protein [Rhizobium ruizarguesonis]
MENRNKDLGRRATEATVKFVAVLWVMIFVAAGSLSYWKGWLFLLNFCGWIIATTAYFLRYDRTLLEQRLHVGPGAERQPAQKRIQLFNSVVLIALFVGSALDHRFGWSTVPVLMVIFGNLLVTVGFYGCFLVLRQNSFASATVEIRSDQRVISSGLYSIVRHPMYAAALVLFSGIPLSLGSYWGPLAIPPALAGLAARLLDEEKHMTRDLPGYAECRGKVRYRLLPGLW